MYKKLLINRGSMLTKKLFSTPPPHLTVINVINEIDYFTNLVGDRSNGFETIL